LQEIFTNSGNVAGLTRVFVVEDDEDTADAIKMSFEISYLGVITTRFVRAEGVIDALISDRPELVTIDLGLPGEDGLTLIREIRAISEVPIIVISAHDDDSSILGAIRLGADQFLVKPVTLVAIQAHVEALLRLSSKNAAREPNTRTFEVSGRMVDLDRAVVQNDCVSEQLSKTDLMLLESLSASMGRIIPMDDLKRDVWGRADISDSTLKMAIHRLRQKIGDEDSDRSAIMNHRSIGYSISIS
jgi:DNA-binding response OmpR family regulator